MKRFLPSLCVLSLSFLLLALVLPFLNYLRFAPMPDWFSDSTAVEFLALSAVILLFRRQAAELEVHPAELGLWLLAAVLAVELMLHHPAYVQAGILPIGVIGLTAFAAGAIRQCVLERGRDAVLAALTSALLIGALLQSCLGLLQIFGLAPLAHGYVMFDPFDPGNLIGNIGQRNQYAHYLGWGLISACYLNASGRLRLWLFYPCCVMLALMLAWSGSRLVVAYGLGMAAIAWIWLRRGRGDPAIEAWGRAMAVAVLAIAATLLFIVEIDQVLAAFGVPIHSQSGAQRIMDAGFGARRRVEWLKAWTVFLKHPLIGVGWGGFAAQSVQLEAMGQWGRFPESGLFTHSHNLITQLLAETGLVGTVIAMLSLLSCLIPLFRRNALGPASGAVLAMLMVSIGHSLFEYPLWYPPFLTGFVMLLALSPAELMSLPLRRWLRVGVAGVLALASLLFVANGNGKFWSLVATATPSPNAAESQLRMKALLQIGENPLWSYESDLILSNYINPTRDQLKFKRELFERLAAYRPYQPVLIKLAMLEAYDGEIELAKLNLRREIAAYPDFTPAAQKLMSSYNDPALVPLKQLAAEAALVYRKDGAIAAANWASATVHQPKS